CRPSLMSWTVFFSQHRHQPLRSIHAHALPTLEPFGDLIHTDDGGNPILAGHDRTVRHQSAYFHHQAGGSQKEWRPGRIGARADKDLAGDQIGTIWVKDYVDDPFHYTRRDGTTAEDCAVIAVGDGAQPRKESAAI